MESNTRIRVSQLARTIAAQHNIHPEQALVLVRAAAKELELTRLTMSVREAGEVEAIIAQDLR